MTEIKSDYVTIQRSDEEIFQFLADFRNFGKLMPEQVINFQATAGECSFTIKGMADISLTMAEKKPHTLISYHSGNKSPLAFSINSHIQKSGSDNTRVMLVLEADLSPMLKLMAERPLQNFVNLIAGKLKEQMERDSGS